jgi:hypothetical protein
LSSGGHPYQYAIADRPVWSRPAGVGSDAASITALSPSDEAVTRSRQHLANQMPTAGEAPRRLAKSDPNTTSVALWVEVGNVSILLGSDLRNGPGPNCGWNAVVASPSRPSGSASVFKVAHHGDPMAHHDRVWAEMLDTDVIAILAPYRRGVFRPQGPDRERICNAAGQSFISAAPGRVPPSAAVRRSAAALGGVAMNIQEDEGVAGHVRLRTQLPGPGPWEVVLEAPARDFC